MKNLFKNTSFLIVDDIRAMRSVTTTRLAQTVTTRMFQAPTGVENMTKHDIKGPLEGVLGIAQTLASKTDLTPALRSQLKAIEEGTLGVLDTITRTNFVTKPVNPDGLTIRIRNFMRHVNLRREMQADYDGMMESGRLRDSVESMTQRDIKEPLAGVLGIAQRLASHTDLTPALRSQLQAIEETARGILDRIRG